jgi:hypothetical protein
VLLWYSDWTRAEIAEQAHHVVVVSWRRWATSDDPVEQIGIGAIEQSFEPVELRAVEAGKVCLGKRAENEIALLRPAMPKPEQELIAAHIWPLDPQVFQIGVLVALHRRKLMRVARLALLGVRIAAIS